MGLFERRSCLFIGIVAVIEVFQVTVVEVMGVAARRPRLEAKGLRLLRKKKRFDIIFLFLVFFFFSRY